MATANISTCNISDIPSNGAGRCHSGATRAIREKVATLPPDQCLKIEFEDKKKALTQYNCLKAHPRRSKANRYLSVVVRGTTLFVWKKEVSR